MAGLSPAQSLDGGKTKAYFLGRIKAGGTRWKLQTKDYDGSGTGLELVLNRRSWTSPNPERGSQ